MIEESDIILHSGIGLKKLSFADLGNGQGNQTHIGLFYGTISDHEEEYECFTKLIYKDNYHQGISYIDFITDGKTKKMRSPRLKAGWDDTDSTLKKIRSLCIENVEYHILYIQCSLDELHIILFEKESNIFKELDEILGYSSSSIKPWKSYSKWEDNEINAVKNIFLNAVEPREFEYRKYIEQLCLSGTSAIPKSVRIVDYEKIKESCQNNGRLGEEGLNEYLIKEKNSGNISSFIWLNEHYESYKPYDFEVTQNNYSKTYLDAKSTTYEFENPFYLSKSELKFSISNPYHIYRLYDLKNSPRCKYTVDISKLSAEIFISYKKFTEELNYQDCVISDMSLKINPISQKLKFYDISI